MKITKLCLLPLATMVLPIVSVSCANPSKPTQPTDIKEWDYAKNGIYLGRVEAKQDFDKALTPDEAVKLYLQEAKKDPRGFVDDLLYSENYYYLSHISYYPSIVLNKYKAKYEVSDIDSEKLTASISIEKEVEVENDGVVSKLNVNLKLNNMPILGRYAFSKASGYVVEAWKFIPQCLNYSFSDFATEMAKIDDWGIKGDITRDVGGIPLSLDYNFYKDNVISDITVRHYDLLYESLYGVTSSYYFENLLVKGDHIFEGAPNEYSVEVKNFNSDMSYQIFQFNAKDIENFNEGNYQLEIFNDEASTTRPIRIFLDVDDVAYDDYTTQSGKLEIRQSLTKSSVLTFRMVTIEDFTKLKIKLTPVAHKK